MFASKEEILDYNIIYEINYFMDNHVYIGETPYPSRVLFTETIVNRLQVTFYKIIRFVRRFKVNNYDGSRS